MEEISDATTHTQNVKSDLPLPTYEIKQNFLGGYGLQNIIIFLDISDEKVITEAKIKAFLSLLKSFFFHY